MKTVLKTAKTFGPAAVAQRMTQPTKTLVDNRFSAVMQRKLQEAADGALKGPLQAKCATTSRVFAGVAPIQGKFYLKSNIDHPLTMADFTADHLKTVAEAITKKEGYTVGIELIKKALASGLASPGYGVYKSMDAAVEGLFNLMYVERSPNKAAFGPSDKAYGLKKERAMWLAKNCANPDAKYHTIDQLNNVLGISQGKVVDTNSDEAGLFKQALQGSEKHDPYKVPSSDADAERKRIKKACKAGIEHVTTSGGVIHFELENIDMVDVVTRRKEQKSWDITNSELRSIFRAVTRKENRINPDKIKFYHMGKEVAAPWETDPELWSRYKDYKVARNPTPAASAAEVTK